MSLETIRSLASTKSFEWTVHAARRLFQRGINKHDVAHVLEAGEVIEEYPYDTPYHSYLVLGRMMDGRYLHVVCAPDGERLWIITAYWPDNKKWDEGFKIRKERE